MNNVMKAPKSGVLMKWLVMAGLAIIATQSVWAETHTYKGKGEETWSKTGLKPGDVVIIPNGTYSDLKINVQGKGKQDQPIVLKAETPGGVVLTGASWLRYWGYYIVVDGFDFQDVRYSKYKNKVRAIIANRRVGSSSESSKDMCHACVLQRVRINNENDAAVDTQYKWVELYGYNNVVRYNYFGAKKSGSRVLQVQLKHANKDKLPASHIIQRNYFASRNAGKAVGNGGEALLVGDSSMQHVDAKVIVEHNLFYDASISGEPEVISNKSSSNVYRFNTVRNTTASLTLRHGNRNTVEKNWFLQGGTVGAGGVRVIGDDNTVFNNYIAGAAGGGKSASYRPALGIAAGYSKKDDDANINGYQLSERTTLSHNTVVASAQPVMLSTWYNRGKLSMTRPPKETTFIYNLVYQMDVPAADNDWVRGQAISVDFTPDSNYGNDHGQDKAEYVPSFAKIKGNITDGTVSDLVSKGTKAEYKKTLKECDAFGTGDIVYEPLKGAGADLSVMAEPLVWTEAKKSARLGPDWLNSDWRGELKVYTPCK